MGFIVELRDLDEVLELVWTVLSSPSSFWWKFSSL